MRVYMVQSIRYIEDFYAVSCVEGLFINLDLAEKWVETQKASEQQLRADRQRLNEIHKEWHSAHQFVFNEEKPAPYKRWPSGMREVDITDKMRDAREAQKLLLEQYNARYEAALGEHMKKLKDHISSIWEKEGRTGNPSDLPTFHEGPTEYTISETTVHCVADS